MDEQEGTLTVSSSPRTRGDGPLPQGWDLADGLVLPAHAGMARPRPAETDQGRGFSPHTRGWPGFRCGAVRGGSGSPRTRGDGPANGINPMEAALGSPRTRGDGPLSAIFRWAYGEFSPHTRGWPGYGSWVELEQEAVLPAHAGMARSRPAWCPCPARSPRTRGDGPRPAPFTTKGFHVLPAHAGMARDAATALSQPEPFSPHTRGWPGRCCGDGFQCHRSPRTRGDGPLAGIATGATANVLPAHAGMARTNPAPPVVARIVLPAHAGMARSCDRPSWELRSFSPHTRGWPVASTAEAVRFLRSPRTRGDGPVNH